MSGRASTLELALFIAGASLIGALVAEGLASALPCRDTSGTVADVQVVICFLVLGVAISAAARQRLGRLVWKAKVSLCQCLL